MSGSDASSSGLPARVPRAIMRSMLLPCLIATLVGQANAQSTSTLNDPVLPPPLPKRGPRPQAFVPPGWAIETQLSGDINDDGVADVVLVLKKNAPQPAHKQRRTHEDLSWNTDDRLLVGLYKNQASQDYTLGFTNATLIPPRTLPDMTNRLSGITLRKGLLKIDINLFMAMGSWSAYDKSFKFRPDGGCLRLIGIDLHEYERNRIRYTKLSANYLTGKVNVLYGIHSTSKALLAQQEQLQLRMRSKQAPCIDQVGNGETFLPELTTPLPSMEAWRAMPD